MGHNKPVATRLDKSERKSMHRRHGVGSVDPDSTCVDHAKLLKDGTLIVDFVSGETYAYGGCDKSDLRAISGDEGSAGRNFNFEIRE